MADNEIIDEVKEAWKRYDERNRREAEYCPVVDEMVTECEWWEDGHCGDCPHKGG